MSSSKYNVTITLHFNPTLFSSFWFNEPVPVFSCFATRAKRSPAICRPLRLLFVRVAACDLLAWCSWRGQVAVSTHRQHFNSIIIVILFSRPSLALVAQMLAFRAWKRPPHVRRFLCDGSGAAGSVASKRRCVGGLKGEGVGGAG